MEITNVDIRPIRGRGNLKALCSVVFDDCFVVHAVKIMEGDQGLYVAMPSRKVDGRRFLDVAHPTNERFRHTLEKAVIQKYRETIGDLTDHSS